MTLNDVRFVRRFTKQKKKSIFIKNKDIVNSLRIFFNNNLV